MKPLDRVLETALYATDLDAAERFYTSALGLTVYAHVPGRHVFFRVGQGMFLVFNPAATEIPPPASAPLQVPTHGARGPGHAAFAIPMAEVDAWRERLEESGVAIEAEVTWPGGGRSLYFRDPAGNSVELATPSLWRLEE